MIGKLRDLFKSNGLKKLEEDMLHCIEKAEELFETKPYPGVRYLKLAKSKYERWEGNKKEVEEVRMILDSIAYAYPNPGEPIK